MRRLPVLVPLVADVLPCVVAFGLNSGGRVKDDGVGGVKAHVWEYCGNCHENWRGGAVGGVVGVVGVRVPGRVTRGRVGYAGGCVGRVMIRPSAFRSTGGAGGTTP